MKLIVVTSGGMFPFSESGPAITLYALLLGLSERGHEAEVFLSGSRIHGVKRLRNANISIICHSDTDRPFFSNLRTMKKALEEFIREVRHADIVMFNTPPVDPAILPYSFLSKCFRKKQVSFCRGGLLNEDVNTMTRHIFHSMANAKVFDRIYISLSYLQHYCGEIIGPEDLFEIVPNCIITRQYLRKSDVKLLKGDPSILYAGNLIWLKRVDVLLKAFSLLPHCYANARLYIAGTGELHVQLSRLAEELQISHKVIFLGRVPHKVLVELFQSADIFVLPSNHECMSISLLEAMASGCAAVTTPAGGVELVRNRENGLIFTRGDCESLKEALVLLIKDLTLRCNLAKKGSLSVLEKCDYKVVAAKMERSLQSLVRE
jgi:glycosyltransferase involved in cell wall biosynthesis